MSLPGATSSVYLIRWSRPSKKCGPAPQDSESGGDILPEVQILAVADVVEAMSSYRPYRAALGIEAALEEVTAGSETRYDPDVVAACVRLFRKNGFAFSA